MIYKKIHLTSYVSIRSSIINHSRIVLSKFTIINSNVTLWPTKLHIGENSQINPGTAIYGNVFIGNNVMIAPNCMIAGGNHNFLNINTPMRFQGSNEKGIVINDDVWIGANTVILDGVTIGKGTIVGAGSVVTKNLESYSIYFGNPVKFSKRRDG
jgi:acetyltransferase-like isoleucine patch superfamily enzyme